MGRAVNSCTLAITYDEQQGCGESRGDFIRIMGVHSTLDGFVLVPLTDVAGVVCEPRGPRGVITCEVKVGPSWKGILFIDVCATELSFLAIYFVGQPILRFSTTI